MSPRSGAFWKIYSGLARRMIGEAACVIAISDFERNLLVRAGLRADNVMILPPGVDLTGFATARASIFERYGMAGNRVIVSLGRLAFGKRVDRLIHAIPAVLQKNPDVRVLIIGPDYGDEHRLRQITKSLQLDDVITFAGALSQDDVAAALQWSSAFAMTSDFELFGITLIEAMAAGAAVIAPGVASIPYVVRHGETGLLYRHDDVEDLSKALIRVLSDEKLRDHLIETGKRETSTRFDFQRNLDALEDIYKKARAV